MFYARQNQYFNKEDERLLRKLLSKVKKTSDVSDKHAAVGVAAQEKASLEVSSRSSTYRSLISLSPLRLCQALTLPPVPEPQAIVGKYKMSEEDLAGEAPAPLSSLSSPNLQQEIRIFARVVHVVLPLPLSLCSCTCVAALIEWRHHSEH